MTNTTLLLALVILVQIGTAALLSAKIGKIQERLARIETKTGIPAKKG